MLALALKTLWRDRMRFLLTAGGVAVSTMLILVMNGLFAGSSRQISLYIDRSGADLFVAQQGVRNMHMASSVLPLALGDSLAAVEGVAAVEPILYFSTILERDGQSDLVYAIGLRTDARMGGPWEMAEGAPAPGPGEVIVSEGQWGADAPAPGATVRLAGRSLSIAGYSRGTKGLASPLVFLHADDAAAMKGAGRANYFLLQASDGADLRALAATVEQRVTGVTVLTRDEMAESDRQIALQMGIDILRIMSLVGFVIGLAVVTLTIYAATVEQLRQYGVLKAIGAGPAHLFVSVAGQGLAAAVSGFAGGVLLTAVVSALVARAVPGLEIDLVPSYTLRVFGLVLAMGLGAAIPPYWRIHRVDPVSVFQP